MFRINSAGKSKIGANGKLPNMSMTIIDWFQPITFGIIKTTVVDYEKKITIDYVDTQGVVQPYKPEPLEIQQAGVRSWSWLMIHCLPDLQLYNNEYIMYENVRYKILQRNDYNKYGYIEYIACEAFEDE